MGGSFFLILLIVHNISGLCEFVGLIASCEMELGGVPVTAFARVNHCHAPVDVTFQVHSEPPANLTWRYTYVTTNLAENAVITQHVMLAMMANQVEGSERMSIQARFLLDGGGGSELEFLDTNLILPPPQENCLPVRLGAGPGWIAGACLLGLGVASLVVSVAIVKSRSGRGSGMGRRIRRRFMPRNNTDGTVVQYVVPAEVPSDLKVYISTSDGLQPAPALHEKLGSPAEEKTKDRLTADDLVTGITNHGYISEDEVGRPEDKINEVPGGSGGLILGQLPLKDEEDQGSPSILSNNNHVKLDLYSTGAIPKKKLEA